MQRGWAAVCRGTSNGSKWLWCYGMSSHERLEPPGAQGCGVVALGLGGAGMAGVGRGAGWRGAARASPSARTARSMHGDPQCTASRQLGAKRMKQGPGRSGSFGGGAGALLSSARVGGFSEAMRPLQAPNCTTLNNSQLQYTVHYGVYAV